jgi:hypothetical protein
MPVDELAAEKMAQLDDLPDKANETEVLNQLQLFLKIK